MKEKKVKNFPLPDLPELQEDGKIPASKLMVHSQRGVNWKLTEKQVTRWLIREVTTGRMRPSEAAASSVDLLTTMKKEWYKALRANRK